MAVYGFITCWEQKKLQSFLHEYGQHTVVYLTPAVASERLMS